MTYSYDKVLIHTNHHIIIDFHTIQQFDHRVNRCYPILILSRHILNLQLQLSLVFYRRMGNEFNKRLQTLFYK